MSTSLYPTLIDDQIAEAEQALPSDRILLVFKGSTMQAAQQAAADGFIENPAAWSCRACICGEWTVGYEVRA
ncbi:hypothetical protein ASF84_05210 [Pseudomonas sp. Leaf127]|uniref:hypothetical protein n=1 Tax=Pseudomonas sp. Leaf127 TaxID=1736267 RepID=UPI0007024F25|nr:hypothetical protein [Pseudomonas sp. Leaf127]KQQ60111.1 hypothetical protein ASF84_05210 [Pseudomonas sp. Leaf127]